MKRNRLFLALFALVFLITPITTTAQESPVRIIPLPGFYLCGEISPDGRTVVLYENGIIQADAVVPERLPLQLVDVESGEVTLLHGPSDYATSAAFSPNGNTLASYHGNGYIYMWQVGGGAFFASDVSTEPIKQIPALVWQGQIEFLPDNRTLVVRSSGNTPQFLLWDTETGAITSILTNREASLGEYKQKYLAEGTPDSVSAYAVSPDGQSIVIGSFFDDVWLWSTTSEDKRVVLESNIDKPNLSIRGLYFMPDGRRVVYSQRKEEAIYVLDLDTGVQTVTIPSTTTGVFAVSHDGEQVAWVDREQQALVVVAINQPDQPTVIPLPTDYSIRDQPTCSVIGFTADDSQVVFSGFDAIDSGQSAVYVIDVP